MHGLLDKTAMAQPVKQLIRETAVEERLRLGVEALDGLCEKHVSPGRKGVPDRLITWPGGRMHLIETKRPKGVVRSEQLRDHARRRRLGVEVLVIDTAGKVDTYLSYMKELCGL